MNQLSKQLRIGFLFNHDASHQVAHIAPIIDKLISLNSHYKVVAMVTSDLLYESLMEIVESRDNPNFEIKKLETPKYLLRLFKIANTVAPVQRLYVLYHYLSIFKELDCLVVSEMTSSLLKTKWKIQTPLVIFPHGAGDRAIGYTKTISHYDHILLPGEKVRDRMINEGLIGTDNYSIVGYSKFDLIERKNSKAEGYFRNANPVVLYNPHFDAYLSSWYQMGMDVLDFFAHNQDYNLIVAPHVMLFKKNIHFSLEDRHFKWVKAIPKRYFEYPNIKIDLGSVSSINMDYSLGADIYLGDVSSQVYEFLYKPRPCIFLNSHRADWVGNPNYKFWECGSVLTSVKDLGSVLEKINDIQERYRETQVKMFKSTFDLNDLPSSLRAAKAIQSFLSTEKKVLRTV
ncbi:MAG: CDP-glycerol glycerophosphotransferase family protein [Nitrosomonas sp.]|nr:CDP-glycerol glycerophosphotransferase family protein [Nitrosomonas sp.]